MGRELKMPYNQAWTILQGVAIGCCAGGMFFFILGVLFMAMIAAGKQADLIEEWSLERSRRGDSPDGDPAKHDQKEHN